MMKEGRMLQGTVSSAAQEMPQEQHSEKFDLFDSIDQFGVENLYFYRDPACGLKAIIAIHNTQLGPALGGCRLIAYSSEKEAIQDALGLARGMSYKAAIHRLPFGGGKAVLIKPEEPIKDRQSYFESFGRFVESLNGRYITAVDSGTGVADMDYIAQKTRFVTSTSSSIHGTGDPSPLTACGILSGITSAIELIWKTSDLKGFRVAIQGVGHVGYLLAKALHSRGADLYVSNRGAAKAERCRQEFGATIVNVEDIHRVECEIFSPCALSGALSRRVVSELKCRLVAGSANIQLASPEIGLALHEREITYLPDYVLNAGGLMHVALKYRGMDDEAVLKRVRSIGATISRLLERSHASGRPTSEIADVMAEEALYGADKKAST